ncbi:MAG TPA: hypothetical protein VF203_02355 [Burkholderiales bacterium]
MVPTVDVGAVRDSNLRLTTGPHDSTTGYIAAARMDVTRETEVSQAELNGFVAHTRYSGDEFEDKTDYGLTLDATHRTSERGTLGLDARYRREALFETVILVPADVGDIRDVDVGLSTETVVRRNYRVLQPSWRWLLTERSAIELRYRLTDVSFSDRPQDSELLDYEENLVSAIYSRQLSARDELLVTANASRYRPEDTDAEAETVQLLIGRARTFSETLRGSISVGAGRTTEREGGIEEDSTGLVIDARLRQRAEISTLDGVISRTVTPSGIGRVLRTDQLRVLWSRRLGPALEFGLEARLLRTRVVEGVDPSADRRYYEIAPRLSWQWLEDVAIVGTYRYRRQRYDVDTDTADSSAVFLGLSYRL